MYTIENKHSGVVLGTYPGQTEEDALNAMAKDAGYASFEDIPSGDREELLITED